MIFINEQMFDELSTEFISAGLSYSWSCQSPLTDSLSSFLFPA